MIVLLAILAATRAYPAALQSPPVPTLHQLPSVSCSDPNNSRSLWDIIRSCASTLFLCTWVSVHPNIPSPDEGWPRVAIRRVGLMLAILVVPEAIIAWALRQRMVAGILAERHKGEGWTLTHGFFATMGGFMEYEGNKPIRVLLPGQLKSYSLTGNGNFPRLSKREIQDKSKGDFISKAVVVLQTSWFVMQCVARGVQGLPITELELATIAFAGLNFVLYLLWWDKPLNVECGVRVYKQRRTDDPVDDGDVEATAGFWVALRDATSKLPAAIIRGPLRRTDDFDELDEMTWLVRVLVWPINKISEILFGIFEDKVGKRVATFYPSGLDLGSPRSWFFAMIIAGIASAFGGIHCIGWSFAFPSSTERTLWRVASISIASIPIALFLPIFLAGCRSLGSVHYWFINHVSDGKVLSYAWSQALLYVLSRLVLLILPFLSLRSLPLDTYYTVHWTSFIPHI